MNSLSARRRHPAAAVAVVLLALLATGALYALFAPRPQAAEVGAQTSPVEQGRDLFLANCSSCHGVDAEGTGIAPSLVGVGAASVDFQVGTGRMPAYTYDVQQVPKVKPVFTQSEIDAMAAYVASLGPGPAIPTEDQYNTANVSAAEIAEGGEIFRTNCAMCHNAVGAGGALTHGKYAPSLKGVTPKHIFEAMETGPQSMPVFGKTIPSEDKTKVIAYLKSLEQQPDYGGLSLGSIGPVSEGLLIWTVGIGALIAFAVWLGHKSS